uniref:Coiled-coil domain-containing protein 151-like n=1 Tax=Maylandia zebra TaxID=106582 RepID=A0A3P9CF39_9CICH
AAIMKNQELIHQLREDNRRLHRKLAGAHAVRWSQHKLKMFESMIRVCLQNLRVLENSLEKSQFKCKEAENIMIDYLKLKSHLQDESLAYQSQLDTLQAEILKHREELRSLQVVNTDSQLSKEAAKAELQQQEELLHKECKERDQVIASYRKKVDEHKAQAAKVERRVQRAAVQLDELSSEVQHSTTRMLAEEEKDISTAEEAFRRIKEATGITDIQKETRRHLERRREENEEVLLQLKEQKELLEQQSEEIKYSGEAKLSSHQQMLQEREQQLQAEQQRCDEAEERLDRLVKTLGPVRHGVEHLADHLQHISLVQTTIDKSDKDWAHVISREALKRQSQLIVDSNSKRKAQKKRKGKF